MYVCSSDREAAAGLALRRAGPMTGRAIVLRNDSQPAATARAANGLGFSPACPPPHRLPCCCCCCKPFYQACFLSLPHPCRRPWPWPWPSPSPSPSPSSCPRQQASERKPPAASKRPHLISRLLPSRPLVRAVCYSCRSTTPSRLAFAISLPALVSLRAASSPPPSLYYTSEPAPAPPLGPPRSTWLGLLHSSHLPPSGLSFLRRCCILVTLSAVCCSSPSFVAWASERLSRYVPWFALRPLTF